VRNRDITKLASKGKIPAVVVALNLVFKCFERTKTQGARIMSGIMLAGLLLAFSPPVLRCAVGTPPPPSPLNPFLFLRRPNPSTFCDARTSSLLVAPSVCLLPPIDCAARPPPPHFILRISGMTKVLKRDQIRLMTNSHKSQSEKPATYELRLHTAGKSPFGDTPEEVAFRAYLCWAQFPGE